MHSEAYYENLIKNDIIELLKWSPGIIFPLGNIMQIIEMYKTKKASQIDEITYLMFFIGNIGGYLFNRLYLSLKTFLAYILPSMFYIYILILKYNTEKETTKELTYGISLSSVLFLVVGIIITMRKNKYFQSIVHHISELGGFLPAILFPVATVLQLHKLIQNKKIGGVSESTWILMFVGNVGLYALSGRYTSWKAILGYLGSAMLNLGIVFYIVHLKSHNKDQ
tara:strand:- start:2705 stop:3376 length:672 start_codon:yes stop_codon:yes gene_type:complete